MHSSSSINKKNLQLGSHLVSVKVYYENVSILQFDVKKYPSNTSYIYHNIAV